MVAEHEGAFRTFDWIKEDAMTELAFLIVLDLHRRGYICTFKG